MPLSGFVLSILAASMLVACNSTEESSHRTENLTSTGVSPAEPLVVAADVGFAPHAMARPDGTTEGFNIELAEEIALRLGRNGYEIIDQEWSGMFAGLNAKRFEFIIAPTTMTYERSEEVLFTEGYLDTDYTFLIKNDSPDINSLEDIRSQVISVNNGSAYDIWATANKQEYDLIIQRYGKNADAVQAVVAGRAFANLAGETVAKWAAKQSKLVRTTYTIKSGSKFSVAFRHEDVAYRNRFEEHLECMKVDGTLARLHEKWFGDSPSEGDAVITPLEGYGEPKMVGYDATPHASACY